MKKIQLFCLPYAGGNAGFYYIFNNYLDENIEVVPVELKGHGIRLAEPLAQTFEEMVEDCQKEILKKRDFQKDYAFFGYSMGNLLVYELAHFLQKEKGQPAAHLFFAASDPPHIKKNGEVDSMTLTDSQFTDKLASLGGLPEEILENEELLELFMPIIRSDFELSNKYNFLGYPPFDCDISVFSGSEDSFKDLGSWTSYTKGKCSFYPFKGSHFFILHEVVAVAEIINDVFKNI